MEKKELKKQVLNELLSSEEGYSLEQIEESSKYITNTFTEFKKILVSTGVIKPFEKVTQVQQITKNEVEYLIIKKTRGEYIIIDLYSNVFLNNSNKNIFDLDFFIKNFNETDKISYDAILFDNKPGDIDKIYLYYLKHQSVLGLGKQYIYYPVQFENNNAIVYYSLITGETIIHIRENNYSNNIQIYLFKHFEPADPEAYGYSQKIPKIKIPESYIPKSVLTEYKIKAKQ